MTSNASDTVRLNRDDVEQTVIAIISRNQNLPESQIWPSTDLVVDLGLTRADARDILLQIAKVYRIDFAGTGLAARFGSDRPQPWQWPAMIFRILTYPFARWALGRLHREVIGPGILVSDLADAVMEQAAKANPKSNT